MLAAAPEDFQRLGEVRLIGVSGFGVAVIDLAGQPLDLAPGKIDGDIARGGIAAALLTGWRVGLAVVALLCGVAVEAVSVIPASWRVAAF